MSDAVREDHEFLGALTDDSRDLRLQSYVKNLLAKLIEHQMAFLGEGRPTFRGLPSDYGQEALRSSTVSII